MSFSIEGTLELIRSSEDDLTQCGPATIAILNRLHSLITTSYSSSPHSPTDTASVRQAIALSSALLQLADEQLLAFPYKLVPECWRRLYTDAALLGVLAELRLVELSGQGSSTGAAELWIRQLDLILIVAGAPGYRRDNITHQLIRHIQHKCFTPEPDSPRPSKRPRLSSPSASPPRPHSPATPPKPAVPSLPSPHVTNPVRRLTAPPSLDDFIALTRDPEPFVITGGCADWPAVERWDAEYLGRKVGPARVVPVEAGGDYTKAGWGQRILPFQLFLDRLEHSPDLPESNAARPTGPPKLDHNGTPPSTSASDSSTLPPSSIPLYLAQHDLFRQFPQLLDDLAIPDYIYACPDPPPDAPSYAPPACDDGYLLNGWLGPAGTVSPAHTDPYFNLYAQVKGRKWVWVAPPGVGGEMAAFGAGDGEAGEGEGSEDEEAEEDAEGGGSAELMTNTARVDVTVDPAEPEFGRRWPGFVGRVAPVARQAVLEAGDLLFVPPGWWHAMKSLDVSFSVSMWF